MRAGDFILRSCALFAAIAISLAACCGAGVAAEPAGPGTTTSLKAPASVPAPLTPVSAGRAPGYPHGDVKHVSPVGQTAPVPAPVPSVALTESQKLLVAGRQALQAGDRIKAQALFTDCVKRFPRDAAAGWAAVEMAVVYRKAGDSYNERAAISTALRTIPDGPQRAEIVTELNRINGILVFSRAPSPDSTTYTVKRGDTLVTIARRFKVTPKFIKRTNGMTSDRVRIGDSLKIIRGPIDVLVEKSKFRLTVHKGGVAIKEYRIGIGKRDGTPEGEYSIKTKVVDPAWDPPGPEYEPSKSPTNPLGTRWMGFIGGEYGIHGTIHPESIGKDESRGCVRMLNRDAEEVFDLVVEGSKVVITD